MTSRTADMYRRRREAGLCARCGVPSDTYHCEPCQKLKSRAQAERRARRKAESAE